MGNNLISETNFNFPGQTSVYHGKVRDMYSIGDKYIIAVATDRISTFDIVLPKPIPYKGQALNQLAEHFLKSVKDIAPVWLIDSPDPNASIGLKCQPLKVEMVIRGYLVGHAWRQYKAGVRELCGVELPEGLNEYDQFDEPIITPTTKSDAGHDEEISAEQIVVQELVTQKEWDELVSLTQKLFKRGQEMAEKRGLMLVDTKYEFGKRDGKIYVIDEIHTADSARYFYADSYQEYLKDKSKKRPKHLSKEFAREWLIERGFMGREGEKLPELSEDFISHASQRYIELFEQLTGKSFNIPDIATDPLPRIEKNVKQSLKQLT